MRAQIERNISNLLDLLKANVTDESALDLLDDLDAEFQNLTLAIDDMETELMEWKGAAASGEGEAA